MALPFLPPRRQRSRGGEQVIGIGVIALGVSIAGRDTWRYPILAMLIGPR